MTVFTVILSCTGYIDQTHPHSIVDLYIDDMLLETKMMDRNDADWYTVTMHGYRDSSNTYTEYIAAMPVVKCRTMRNVVL